MGVITTPKGTVHYQVEDKSGKRFAVPEKDFDASKYAYVRMINDATGEKSYIPTENMEAARVEGGFREYRFGKSTVKRSPDKPKRATDMAKDIAVKKSTPNVSQIDSKPTEGDSLRYEDTLADINKTLNANNVVSAGINSTKENAGKFNVYGGGNLTEQNSGALADSFNKETAKKTSSKLATESTKTFSGDYKSILDDLNAQAKEIAGNTGFYGEAYEQGRLREAANLRSPENIQKQFEETFLKKYIDDTLNNKSASIEHLAKLSNMTTSEYISNYVKPSIVNNVQSMIYGSNLERYLPKNEIDYYVGKMLDSTVGKLASTESMSSQQMLAEALMATEEDKNRHFSVNVGNAEGIGEKAKRLAMRLTGETASIIADSPLFVFGEGAGGLAIKAATKTVAKVAPRFSWLLTSSAEAAGGSVDGFVLSNLSKLTKADKAMWAARTATKGSISGAANMGSFMGFSSAVNEAMMNKDATFSSIGQAYLNGALHGTFMGLGMGVASVPGGFAKMAAKSSAAKVGATALGLGLEIGSMTGFEVASKAMTGDYKGGITWIESLEDTGYMVAGMKFAHIAQHPREFVHSVARTFSKDNSSKLRLEDNEKAFLDQYTGDSLLGSVLHESYDGAKTIISNADKNGNVISKEVGGLIADKNIPWEIRQKLAGSIFGMYESGGRPIFDSFKVYGKNITLYDKDNNPIAVKEYRDGDELHAILSKERAIRDVSFVNSSYGGLSGSIALSIQSGNGVPKEYENLAIYEIANAVFKGEDGQYHVGDDVVTYEELSQRLSEGGDLRGYYDIALEVKMFNPVNGLLQMTADEIGIPVKDLINTMRKEPYRMNDTERANMEILANKFRDIMEQKFDTENAPEVSESLGNMDAEKNDFMDDEIPDENKYDAVNGIYGSVKAASERFTNSVVKLRDALSKDVDDSFYGIDLNSVTPEYLAGLDETTNPEIIDALTEYVNARDTLANAVTRKEAFLSKQEKNIDQALDMVYSQISYTDGGKDTVVSYVDEEGKQWFLRSGSVDENGMLTGDMVTFVDFNGEVKFGKAEDSNCVQMFEQTKDEYLEPIRKSVQEAIDQQFGLSQHEQEIAENNVPVEGNKNEDESLVNQEGETPDNVESQDEIINEEPETPKFEFPKTKEGKDDYLHDSVTPELSLARLREKGLSDDAINQNMDARLKKSKEPKMGDDEDKYIAQLAKYNREQEMYNGIKELIEAERKAATEEAVADTIQTEQKPGEVGQVAVDKWNGSKKIAGRKGSITVNGEKISGQFFAVEVGGLTASHDALNGYKQSEGFPVDENGNSMNSRSYNTEADRNYTEKIANDFGPEAGYLVVQDGIVLSGNGRKMAREIAHMNGTDKRYMEDYKDNGESYGLKYDDVKDLNGATTIFVPDRKFELSPKTFDMFNKDLQKTENSSQEAVRRSRTLTPDEIGGIVASIEEYSSLDNFYKSPKGIADLIKTLRDKGVVADNELAALMDGEKLSAKGEDFVENLVLGAMFNPEQIERLGYEHGLKAKVVNAMKEIMAHKKLGDYALDDVIAETINLVYEAKKAGYKVSALLREVGMFEAGAAERYSDLAQILAIALDGKVADFKDLMRRYNENAASYNSGQMEMFGGLDRTELINEFVKLIDKENGTVRKPRVAEPKPTEEPVKEAGPKDGDNAQGNAGHAGEEVTKSIEDLYSSYIPNSGKKMIGEPEIIESLAKSHFNGDTKASSDFIDSWKKEQIENKTKFGWIFAQHSFDVTKLESINNNTPVDEVTKQLPNTLSEKSKEKFDKLVANIYKYGSRETSDIPRKSAYPSEAKVFDELCEELPFQYGTHLSGRGVNSKFAKSLYYLDKDSNTLYHIELDKSGYKGDKSAGEFYVTKTEFKESKDANQEEVKVKIEGDIVKGKLREYKLEDAREDHQTETEDGGYRDPSDEELIKAIEEEEKEVLKAIGGKVPEGLSYLGYQDFWNDKAEPEEGYEFIDKDDNSFVVSADGKNWQVYPNEEYDNATSEWIRNKNLNSIDEARSELSKAQNRKRVFDNLSKNGREAVNNIMHPPFSDFWDKNNRNAGKELIDKIISGEKTEKEIIAEANSKEESKLSSEVRSIICTLTEGQRDNVLAGLDRYVASAFNGYIAKYGVKFTDAEHDSYSDAARDKIVYSRIAKETGNKAYEKKALEAKDAMEAVAKGAQERFAKEKADIEKYNKDNIGKYNIGDRYEGKDGRVYVIIGKNEKDGTLSVRGYGMTINEKTTPTRLKNVSIVTNEHYEQKKIAAFDEQKSKIAKFFADPKNKGITADQIKEQIKRDKANLIEYKKGDKYPDEIYIKSLEGQIAACEEALKNAPKTPKKRKQIGDITGFSNRLLNFISTRIVKDTGVKVNIISEDIGVLDKSGISARLSTAKVDVAYGIRVTKQEKSILGSILMTHANEYLKSTSNLSEGNENVVKKVLLAGDNCYLWSTKNGYEFFIEKKHRISARNVQNISDLIDTYGIDITSESIINAFQSYKNEKARTGYFIGMLKRAGANSLNRVGDRFDLGKPEISDGTRDNAEGIGDTSNGKIIKTTSGIVLGYVKDGEIYLYENRMKPETPLHEYTHLWSDALRRVNPKEWENVKRILDGVDGLKDEIKKNYPELEGDDLYDEMLATYSGREGGKKLKADAMRIAEEEGKTIEESVKAQSFISKVKDALKKYWNGVADLLGIHFTTADEIANKVLADWANGVNPNKIGEGELGNEGKARKMIGTKRKTEMDAQLAKKRPDMSEEQRRETIDAIEKLGEKVKEGGDPKTEKLAQHWVSKGNLILPEDEYKLMNAMEVAQKKGIDPFSYDNPEQLMIDHSDVKLTEKPKDPDTVQVFSNKKELPNGVTVYDVENTKEGQKAVREIIDTHWGEDANPWCLAARHGAGDTGLDDAWSMWEHYNAKQKKIAFKDGKLLAFHATDDAGKTEWWNRVDSPYEGFEIKTKREDGKTETRIMTEDGKVGEVTKVIKGSEHDGVYDEWNTNGMHTKHQEKKNGKLVKLVEYDTYMEEFPVFRIRTYDEDGRYEDYYQWDVEYDGSRVYGTRWDEKSGSRYSFNEDAECDFINEYLGHADSESLTHKAFYTKDGGVVDMGDGKGKNLRFTFDKNGKLVSVESKWIVNGHGAKEKYSPEEVSFGGLKAHAFGNKPAEKLIKEYLSGEKDFNDVRNVFDKETEAYREILKKYPESEWTKTDKNSYKAQIEESGLTEDMLDDIFSGRGGADYAKSAIKKANNGDKLEDIEGVALREAMREKAANDSFAAEMNILGITEDDVYYYSPHDMSDDARNTMEAFKKYKEGRMLSRSERKLIEDVADRKSNDANNSLRFRTGDTFYSNAENVVRGIKQEKATGEQWLAMIKKNGGLKAEEDKWIGLSDWLNGRNGAITKQEVMDYIAQNAVNVEEVKYNSKKYGAGNISIFFTENDIDTENGFDIERGLEMFDKECGTNALDDYKNGVLYIDDDGYARFDKSKFNPINDTRLGYTTEGLVNKKEIALTVPTVEPYNAKDNVHFGDAGKGRAVAWIRFGDATDADGKNVLVIDEIQSKRHQDARANGVKEEIEQLRNAAVNAERERTKLAREHFGEQGYIQSEEYQNAIKSSDDAQKAYSEYLEDHNGGGKSVPDAPFQKNWHELAMKRALRYAAENGYDKVAWTTGKQQSDRYNLTQVVDSMSSEKSGDDAMHVEIGFKDYEMQSMSVLVDKESGKITKADNYPDVIGDPTGKQLSEFVGKENAIKLLGNEVNMDGSGISFESNGMKGFYDMMLPKFMDKYGKKWGVKTQDVTLDLPNEADRVMHSVDVTPEMRESVMQGQPMFRLSDDANIKPSERRIKKIAERTQSVIDSFGGKGRVVANADELDAIGKRAIKHNPNATGWYDTKTGEVTVYLPNCSSEHEALRTIWHEKIGHEGMRKAFGEEGYKKFYNSLWMAMSEAERSVVSGKAQTRGWDYHEAMDEHLAEIAEDFDHQNNNYSLWQKIKDAFNLAIYKITGRAGTMTMDDVRTAMWLSKYALENKTGSMEYRLRKAAFEAKLRNNPIKEPTTSNGYHWGESSYEHSDISKGIVDVDDSGKVRLRIPTNKERKAIDDEFTFNGKLARDIYEGRIRRTSYLWTEAHANNMESLKIMQEAICGGKDNIKDSENAMMALNHVGSMDQQEQGRYTRKIAEPLIEHVKKLLPNVDGKTPEEREKNLESYIHAKSGLERNRVIFVRDALAKMKGQHPITASKLQNEFDTERASLYSELVAKNIDLREFYNGLDKWINDNIGDFDAGYMDNAGLSDGDKYSWTSGDRTYNDDSVIQFVIDTESRLGDSGVSNLWKLIRKASEYSVDKDYNCGYINTKAKNRMNTMFDWYVPMRGFNALTAEEQWNYINGGSSYVGMSAMKMNGRGSAPDSPLATLLAMGNAAIMRGNRNVAKQTLVRLARNNKNDLLREVEISYVKEVNHASGEITLTPIYPEFRESMTASEIESWMNDFENEVEIRKQNGEDIVKLKDMSSSMRYRIEEPKDANEHIINVMVGGKRVSLMVFGHPRAAQAVNGMLNNTGSTSLKKLNSTLSQLATSRSLTFMARNAIRDWGFASSSALSTESAKWNKNFHATYAKLNLDFGLNTVRGNKLIGNGNSMRQMFKKYNEGTLDLNNETEMYFKQYVDNGGVTGYVQMEGVDSMKDLLLKNTEDVFKSKSSKMRPDKAIVKVMDSWFKLVEGYNEAIENQTRFSAFVASKKEGRSTRRAINDAKNISVNFNLTGAGKATKSMKFGDSSTWYRINRNAASYSAWFLKNTAFFYNAGIQGFSRVCSMFSDGDFKTRMKLAANFIATPLAFGMSMAGLNAVIASRFDDEDDRKKYGDNPYLQLPEFERRQNMCFYIGKGRFVKIPLSIEQRAAYGIGDIASGLIFGNPEQIGDRNIASQVAEQITQITPVDVMGGSKLWFNDWTGSVLGVAMPGALQPALACLFPADGSYREWTGARISTAGKYNENDPNWTKGTYKTYDIITDIAHGLNTYSYKGMRLVDQYVLGGTDKPESPDAKDGSGVMSGPINLDPGRLQYLLESYGSGPLKDVSETTKALIDMVESEEVDNGKVPILKAVYRDNTPTNVRNNDKSRWYEYTNKSEKMVYEMKKYSKHGSTVDSHAMLNTKDGKIALFVYKTNKYINRLNKAKNGTNNANDKRFIQDKINDVIRQSISTIDEMEKSR